MGAVLSGFIHERVGPTSPGTATLCRGHWPRYATSKEGTSERWRRSGSTCKPRPASRPWRAVEAGRELIEAGRELIDAERALDALFGGAQAGPQSLEAAVRRAEQARARVRLAHLEAHLEMRELLSESQVEAYVRLRGYGEGEGGHDPSRHH